MINEELKKLGWLVAVLPLLGVVGCADHWDEFTPSHEEEEELGIAFSGSVVSSRVAQDTRSDGSVVNLNETSLLETQKRTYTVWDNVAEGTTTLEEEFHVGIFGAYTGQYKWSDLKTAYTTAYTESGCATEAAFWASEAFRNFLTTDEGKAYSANFLFNQQATIGAAASGVNPLTYSPLRFWPNNKLTSDATKYEYATFWAYYPWNETDDPGENGISIVTDSLKGRGMGSVRFTMHPDASQQSDFMVSELVTDCSKDTYPLLSDGVPKAVPFRFHHLLAQVRLYAFIRGTDRVVYLKDADEQTVKVTASETEGGVTTLTLSDGTTRVSSSVSLDYLNPWGVTQTLAVGDSIPDDAACAGVATPQTVRWQRTSIYSPSGEKYRMDATLTMSFNNIYTSAIFTPTYDTVTGKTTFPYSDAGSLGSATVNHYIQNPYWFHFDEDDADRRVMLNDDYMHGFFENTAANAAYDADTNPLGDDKLKYLLNDDVKAELLDHQGSDNHYNYAPGNILLVVPQVLRDDDVPNIVITAKGKDASTGSTLTGRVTINMLNMNIKWESGFIYCYAFVDELMPGDDKVRGPESINVVFDWTKHTDQW